MTRKQKMAARATAERLGRAVALREAASLYLLVYRARGGTGPYPLPTLGSPGLLGWELIGGALPVVVGR